VNGGISPLSRALGEENRWRAQRYGTEGTYLDEATRETISFTTLLQETVAHLEDDIAALGTGNDIPQLCLSEQCRTSAHRQLRRYHRAWAAAVSATSKRRPSAIAGVSVTALSARASARRLT
jgi:gamma-glutamyl:cysteine ligase YbdK (ATP-grasp superfamily)